jgi:amino acid adenylation domain-containing protein
MSANSLPNLPSVTDTNQQRVDTGNSIQRSYPQIECVPQLVAVQVAETPDAIAVTCGKLSLTYKDLDHRADRLAHVLRSYGIGPDITVGLYLSRSLAMIVGALAILKAGGAYLPLDPAYPRERLAFLLKNAEARILVTGQGMVERLPIQAKHVIALDPEGRLLASCISNGPIAIDLKPEDLAYIIYTSGSTGQPKGVELTHRGLSNLVRWHRHAFNVGPEDRASQVAALSFDAAVWEIWPYLASGASVHLADCLAINDPEAVRDWLVSRGITICFLPTPLAERVITLEWPRDSTLRMLLTGADTLHHYPSPHLPFQLVNNYGPTECTVVATSGTVFPEERPNGLPTIGRPIDNTQIYILNENMRQASTGEAGEIYIGGAGLARGYRNRDDLTSEKFVASPFSAEPGARLYRTGDLGRWLPDGQIAFLGRVDEQIKILGFRIEPAEIVRVLNEHPAVQASAAVAREIEPGDKRLVAYLVLARDVQPTFTEMHEFVATRLPEHMLPTTFVTLPALPVNPSGKVDRALLPDPDLENTLRDRTFVAPKTALEERVGSILANLLGVEQVSVEDNFFLLGGHSLLGTQLMAKLANQFGVEFSLLTLFNAPTVAMLSREIEKQLLAKLDAMSDEEARACLAQARAQRATSNASTD